MTIISFIENVQKLFDEFHIYTLLMEFQADKSSNLVSNAFENIEKNKQALETWLKQNNSSVTQADIDSFETEFRVGVLNDIRTSTPYAFPRNGLSASVEFRKHFLLEYENNVLAWTLAWCYEKYELLLKKYSFNAKMIYSIIKYQTRMLNLF